MLNGTDNADIQLLSGGKSSEDWDKLSIADVKLLTVDHYAKEERAMRIMTNAFKEALFGKKKNYNDMRE